MISINIYEIVMQMVNFLILLFLVNRYLVKPVGKFLEERSNTIKNDLDRAENNKEESNRLLAEQKEVLKNARVEAKDIRDAAEEISKRERAVAVNEAKNDAKRIVDQARKDIEQNVMKVKQTLLSETGEIAVLLTENILKREINSADKQALVSESLERIQANER